MTQIRLDETMHYEFDDSEYTFRLDALLALDAEEARMEEIRKVARTMTMDEIAHVLDYEVDICEDSNAWNAYYDVYQEKEIEEDRRYYEENIDRFLKFQDEVYAMSENGTLDADTYDYYSDWHKDMYGCRPHNSGLKVRKN